MKILLTGAGGMLAHAVSGCAEARGHDVLSFTRAELDVTNGPAVHTAIKRARPEVVVQCAAYTRVRGMPGLPPTAELEISLYALKCKY